MAFHLGTIPEPGLSFIADHLESCDVCEVVLRELESQPNPVLAALRRTPNSLHPLTETKNVPAGARRPFRQRAESEQAVPGGTNFSQFQSLLRADGYELVEAIGRGGMGIVFRARDLALNRDVAIKVLMPGSSFDPGHVARFRAEAEAVARLQSPNIVQIFAIGEREACPYLALEYVAGGNLAQKLDLVPLSPEEAARLLHAIALAVAVAHRERIVHRDLKPANILLTTEGLPKITDFGLAKQMNRDLSLTATGAVMGTPNYMAPEQFQAKHDLIGPATDVYALGAILYEMLCGRPPFLGTDAVATADLVCHRDPVPPRQFSSCLSRDLQTICLKCLEKHPSRRYASAQELADDLERYRANRPIHARPSGIAEKSAKWARRHPAWAALAASFLIGALALATGLWAYTAEIARTRNATRAEGLVRSLATSDTEAVPRLLRDLDEVYPHALPQLRQSFDESAPDSRQRLHAALALLRTDPDLSEFLQERLLSSSPRELLVIRDALAPFAEPSAKRWWPVVLDAGAPGGRRLRAACGLAATSADDPRWAEVSAAVVRQLLSENPLLVVGWMEALRPVRAALLEPLRAAYANRQLGELERRLATEILADYASDQPKELANLLLGGDEKQFVAIYPKLIAHREAALASFAEELAKTLPEELPSSDWKRETLAKRQANAAVALLRMNRAENVWPLLKQRPDPRVRSYLLHRLFPLGVEPAAIVRRMEEERDVSARRALLLSLGEFDESTFPAVRRKAVLPAIQQMYRTDPDPGLHSAAEWLLRTWKEDAWLKKVNDEWARSAVRRKHDLATGKGQPQWYIDGQGHTMVVIFGPVVFDMGSPSTEAGRMDPEHQHRRRIGRTFALATKAVTLEQFRRLGVKNYELTGRLGRLPSLPMVGTDFLIVARYCNWLSEREGIPVDQWCFEVKLDRLQQQVLHLKENYLSLTGYRPPTGAELEYATRAGSTTSRYFGETEELLDRYAWYQKNSQEQTWPVGSLKPNDLGLFDALGHAFCWSLDDNREYPKSKGIHEDTEGELAVKLSGVRIARGGGFSNPGSQVRSALRASLGPASRTTSCGFRVARTLR